jgi:hypothetical protein
MKKQMHNNSKILKFMYVTGAISSTTETGVVNTPLIGSVAFLKSKDFYVASDYWKSLLNFEFSAYEEVITTLRAGMSGLKEIANRTAYEDMMTKLHTKMSDGEKLIKSLVPAG